MTQTQTNQDWHQSVAGALTHIFACDQFTHCGVVVKFVCINNTKAHTTGLTWHMFLHSCRVWSLKTLTSLWSPHLKGLIWIVRVQRNFVYSGYRVINELQPLYQTHTLAFQATQIVVLRQDQDCGGIKLRKKYMEWSNPNLSLTSSNKTDWNNL